jgi:hypothetical protein
MKNNKEIATRIDNCITWVIASKSELTSDIDYITQCKKLASIRKKRAVVIATAKRSYKGAEFTPEQVEEYDTLVEVVKILKKEVSNQKDLLVKNASVKFKVSILKINQIINGDEEEFNFNY